MLICDLLGLPKVTPYRNNKATPRDCADPSLLYGLELEIENVPNWDEMLVHGMRSVEDGSLRNDGREFLTSPSTFSVQRHILERFFDKNKLTDKNYSERCSIHVHANCQDLTREQLGALCMLYQVYERLLFNFVGDDRDKNIFCIPWDQTTLTYNVVNNIEKDSFGSLKQWQKYTALNLLPLFSLGTVEFRHMSGTNDLEKISIWLNLIGGLFQYARKNSIGDIKEQLLTLNTTSQYDDLTHRVFTFWTKYLINVPDYKQHIEEGVLNMKYSMLVPKKLTTTNTASYFTTRVAEALAGNNEIDFQVAEQQLRAIAQEQERARVNAQPAPAVRPRTMWDVAMEQDVMRQVFDDPPQAVQPAEQNVPANPQPITRRTNRI